MVNTFLPSPDFAESARVLDRQRLGKQRVEVIQLLKANMGMTKGWRNHPAAVMWRGHELALTMYGIAVCREWRHRGYKDNCELQISLLRAALEDEGKTYDMPSWLGMDSLHQSHQSNLLRKDPEFYSQYNWQVDDSLPYVWPTP